MSVCRNSPRKMNGFSVLVTGLLCHIGFSAADNVVDRTKFMFFVGNTFDENEVYTFNNTESMFRHPQFDKSRLTVFYMHGYLEGPSNESLHVIVDAYLQRKDHNIIVLDWSESANGNYLLSAVANAVSLSKPLAAMIRRWFLNGQVNIDLFHVVSHSLGAQMSGMVGRNVIHGSKGEMRLRRISGLDPANPPFFPSLIYMPLSKNDAQFVDIIHTDAGLYGAPVATGTIDFWPNGGASLQPGCPHRTFIPLTPNDLCSHRRSWRFWAESVTSSTDSGFIGVKAANWLSFKFGRAEQDNLATMGLDCSTNVSGGNYYLQTNAELPFARGIGGTVFDRVTEVDRAQSDVNTVDASTHVVSQ